MPTRCASDSSARALACWRASRSTSRSTRSRAISSPRGARSRSSRYSRRWEPPRSRRAARRAWCCSRSTCAVASARVTTTTTTTTTRRAFARACRACRARATRSPRVTRRTSSRRTARTTTHRRSTTMIGRCARASRSRVRWLAPCPRGLGAAVARRSPRRRRVWPHSSSTCRPRRRRYSRSKVRSASFAIGWTWRYSRTLARASSAARTRVWRTLRGCTRSSSWR
mmetsp:Transcript_35290/g.88018  ORF Transcript_35290/g.88018 Transcript_35290/m.88018 type:complete len:226 (+) Transcript_35290:405-1082(+)